MSISEQCQISLRAMPLTSSEEIAIDLHGEFVHSLHRFYKGFQNTALWLVSWFFATPKPASSGSAASPTWLPSSPPAILLGFQSVCASTTSILNYLLELRVSLTLDLAHLFAPPSPDPCAIFIQKFLCSFLTFSWHLVTAIKGEVLSGCLFPGPVSHLCLIFSAFMCFIDYFMCIWVHVLSSFFASVPSGCSSVY